MLSKFRMIHSNYYTFGIPSSPKLANFQVPYLRFQALMHFTRKLSAQRKADLLTTNLDIDDGNSTAEMASGYGLNGGMSIHFAMSFLNTSSSSLLTPFD
jgi:hypothetical protein